MPNRPNYEESQKPEDFVNETHEIFNTYSKERETWARQAKEDKEFRLGRQWTREQEEVLKSRGKLQ